MREFSLIFFTIFKLILMIHTIGGKNVNENLNGQSNALPIRTKRLVVWNGEAAQLHDYPWLAMIWGQKLANVNGTMKDTGKRFRACAGSLLNHRYVLTVAHCLAFTKNDRQLIAVGLGLYDIKYDNCGPSGDKMMCHDAEIDIPIEDKIIHENFINNVRYNNGYDIGLVKLSKRVRYNYYIWPIALPTSSFTPPHFLIVGWGVTENGFTSTYRRKAKIPLYDWKKCSNLYGNLSSRQICAGADRKGIGACQGDSGSPLMSRKFDASTSTIKWTIYGIVSYGRSCHFNIGNWPSVYTKVYDYVPWIKSKMQD